MGGSVCSVSLYNGLPVYAMCERVNRYTVNYVDNLRNVW